MVPNTFGIWATWLLWHQALSQQKRLLKALSVGLSFRLIPIGWCSFKAFVQMTFLSLCSSERHPRPGLRAILCPSAARNSVLEEGVHSPALLGSKGRFFFPGLCCFTKARWQCKLSQLKKLPGVAEQGFDPCFCSVICLSTEWLLRVPVWMVFI